MAGFWRNGDKIGRSMVLASGVPTGHELEERGDVAASRLRGVCQLVAYHKADGMCCQRKFLSLQPDFVEQEGVPYIKEIVEKLVHLCLFLPKYYCELTIIEYFWGTSKRYAREHCQYDWEGLKTTVPEALESVKLETMKR